jgi:hypothetical protein
MGGSRVGEALDCGLITNKHKFFFLQKGYHHVGGHTEKLVLYIRRDRDRDVCHSLLLFT